MYNTNSKEEDLILMIAKMLEMEDARCTVVNEDRVKDVKTVYDTLRKIVSGDEVTVTYCLYKPFQMFGSVSVNGKCIEVTDTKAFAYCGTLADNYELYPLVDGTVKMSFSFSNLKVRGE